MQTSLRSNYQSYYDYSNCSPHQLLPAPSDLQTQNSNPSRAFIQLDSHQNQHHLHNHHQEQHEQHHQLDNLNLEEAGKYQLEGSISNSYGVDAADENNKIICYTNVDHHHHHHHQQQQQQQHNQVYQTQHLVYNQQHLQQEVPADQSADYRPQEDWNQASYQQTVYQYEPNQFEIVQQSNGNDNGQTLLNANHQHQFIDQQQEYVQYEQVRAENEDIYKLQSVYEPVSGLTTCNNQTVEKVDQIQLDNQQVGYNEQHHQQNYHLLTGYSMTSGQHKLATLREGDSPACSTSVISCEGSQSLQFSSESDEEEEEEDDDDDDDDDRDHHHGDREEDDDERGHQDINGVRRKSTNSTTTSSSGRSNSSAGLTRDEKRAKCANIPLSYHDIVNLSIDQFNDQLAKHQFTEAQLTLIKDIRRRGKNKVAAQSCRKRKMEQIHDLQWEVSLLKSRRRTLTSERAQLIKDHGKLVQEYERVYAIIQEKMSVDQDKTHNQNQHHHNQNHHDVSITF